MQRIKPNLWFNTEASEAVDFYISIFGGSRHQESRFTEAGREEHGMEPGSIMTIEFEIRGLRILALNGGPVFHLNPSVSFMMNFSATNDVDKAYERLAADGQVLMPLDKYDFSERYAWVQDRYGLSWQLIHDPAQSVEKILPSMLFVGSIYGKVRQALKHYTSIFPESSIGTIFSYGPGKAPDTEDAVAYSDFELFGQKFAAMESAHDHKFQFDEAFSFIVECKDQTEIDHYWKSLAADPNAGQCGWTKDIFGFSWQIVPENVGRFFDPATPEASERAMAALLQMKKIDLAALEKAYDG